MEFFVPGVPRPQGSKTLMRGRMVESSKKLPEWRKALAQGATEAQLESGLFFTDPLKVEITFQMPRGKTIKRPLPPVVPDVDKLIRAVLDSMTGILYDDDAQVVEVHAFKVYSPEPGALIRLTKKLS